MIRIKSLLVIGTFVSIAMADLKLNELQQILQKRGARWTADHTEVSELSPKDKAHLTGAILPAGFGDFFAPTSTERSASRFPASLDWRNMNGVNYVSPVLNQGYCGSCVAFSTIATFETQLNIVRKTPYSPWLLSPQHLFSCGGGSCDKGWIPELALNYLLWNGVPDEACFPYASGAKGDDIACRHTCSNADARSETLNRYSQPTINFVDVEAVKAALQKGPVLATMAIYEDFLFYTGGVYKTVAGSILGGHAVSIVGYNSSEKAWIARNSWGPQWGDRGFFKVDWNDKSGVGTYTYGLQVAPLNGFVVFQNVPQRSVVKGNWRFPIVSTFPSTQELAWNILRNDRIVMSGKAINKQAQVNTTKLTDGLYTIVATALHGGKLSESEPVMIHVFNDAFIGSIAFEGQKPGEVLSGAAEIGINTYAKYVPYTSIAFRARNIATGAITTRTTTNVAAHMILGWRTQRTPNGEYDLTLTGYEGKTAVKSTPPLRITLKN